jgi:hypothetical protein
MPYVPEKIRLLYKDTIDHFENMHAEKASAGEVTFLITALMHSWIKKQKWCYLTFCIAIGVLVCTTLELYRMVVSKYEDKKRMESGGVSQLDDISLEETR